MTEDNTVLATSPAVSKSKRLADSDGVKLIVETPIEVSGCVLFTTCAIILTIRALAQMPSLTHTRTHTHPLTRARTRTHADTTATPMLL